MLSISNSNPLTLPEENKFSPLKWPFPIKTNPQPRSQKKKFPTHTRRKTMLSSTWVTTSNNNRQLKFSSRLLSKKSCHQGSAQLPSHPKCKTVQKRVRAPSQGTFVKRTCCSLKRAKSRLIRKSLRLASMRKFSHLLQSLRGNNSRTDYVG